MTTDIWHHPESPWSELWQFWILNPPSTLLGGGSGWRTLQLLCANGCTEQTQDCKKWRNDDEHLHWEYMESTCEMVDLAGSDGPWLWCREHDHQLYPKDADEMSPDSRKYCMCQSGKMESIQDWILGILDRFKIFKFQVFADFFRVWWNNIEPCWRGLAQALGGRGSPWLVWQLVKATSLSLATLQELESNGMWI